LSQTKRSDETSARVASHRARMTAGGSRRVEVTVPNRDAALLKSIAESLRTGGEQARQIRETLKPIVSAHKAKTGADLVAFLQACPVPVDELEIERDRSSGRSADFS